MLLQVGSLMKIWILADWSLRSRLRSAVVRLASAEATLLDYQDVGVLLLARRYGLHLDEADVTMFPRAQGSSKVFASWLMVAGYMAQTTLLCLARVGRWRVPSSRSKEIPV